MWCCRGGSGGMTASGLVCGTATVKEEGPRSLYGGLSAHLMRVVPNAAVMFSIYEGILRWGD